MDEALDIRGDASAHDDFLEFLHAVDRFARQSREQSQTLLDRVAVLEVKYRRRRKGGRP